MREPSDIRASCAAKLAGIETGAQFSALLGCLLDFLLGLVAAIQSQPRM